MSVVAMPVEAGAVVRLADADPALFEGLSDDAFWQARARVTAEVHTLPKGTWSGDLHAGEATSIGLLVLDGLLLRTVSACGRRGAELLGPGDVLRPWEHDGASASIPFDVSWRVLDRARVAILGARFEIAAGSWPSITAAVVGRAVQRAHWLALQLTVADLRRVDERILVALWHFADRWGTARPDGIHVPLPIPHHVLAQLVSAQRPTVSAALGRLREDGCLRRLPDRTWLLLGDPPDPAKEVR